MDTMEVNKGIAAILVAGILFFLTGLIGDNLVTEPRPKKTVLAIQGAPAEAPAAGKAEQPQALPPLAPLLAKADVAAGEAYVKKVCVACHTFDKGGKAGVGPNLYGVVGGPHGHMEGFSYSSALKSKQGPWTFDELNEWLDKPSAYAPGTRMAFAGISNAQERANVIDYLHTLSPNPEPLPSPETATPTSAPGGTPPGQTGGGNQAPQPNAPVASPTPSAAPGQGPAAGGSASAPAAPK
ncbi:MAG: cytochrome c family protein [Acetobacteraceae bacterium]|nr:cytochrome c family protein [Acetobacteraceae bacterium]